MTGEAVPGAVTTRSRAVHRGAGPPSHGPGPTWHAGFPDQAGPVARPAPRIGPGARGSGGRGTGGSAGPEREFVAAIRGELASVEPTRACCRIAERAGLGTAATGEAHSPVVARLAVRLGPRSDSTSTETPAVFDWDSAADHCRMSWLRGLFLARGSLSLGATRTHLEFVVQPADAPVLARRLASIGLPAATRLRRGRGVVTWKSADRVAAFLRGVGAGPSLLELEARGVARTLRGDLNRLLNAEAANLERAVGASARQLQAIATLAGDGRLAEEREAVRAVARARQASPDATLGELAGDLDVTRSSVQRAFERIERLALHPAGADAPFGPGRDRAGPG
jgi:WhiA C-terminal HTH domain/WhiA LAGLIDADG-like domain